MFRVGRVWWWDLGLRISAHLVSNARVLGFAALDRAWDQVRVTPGHIFEDFRKLGFTLRGSDNKGSSI